MNPIAMFLAWRAARRLARIAEKENRRRRALIRQIDERRSAHREWKPLAGELKQSTCAALAAECGREWR